MLRKLMSQYLSAFFLVAGFSAAQTASQSLNVLNEAGWRQIESRGNYLNTQLTMLAIRNQPSLLDDKQVMQCFMKINTAFTPSYLIVNRNLTNELEYPGMASFYKSKAEDALKVVPGTFSIGVLYANLSVAGRPPAPATIMLGEYDQAKKTFPFVDVTGHKTTLTFDNMTPSTGGTCGSFLAFMVRFKGLSFSELPMDEAAARAYLSMPLVGAAGSGRQVSLAFEIEVLPDAPQISNSRSASQRLIVLNGKVKKVTAVYHNATSGDRTIGTVYQ